MQILPLAPEPFTCPTDRDMLPSERREFVRTHRTCVFGTPRRADGPAMSIVYYVPTDTDELLVSTMRDRGKAKVVARNPKVSLCVLDERWPFSYLQVYCDATVDDDPDLVVDVMMAVGGRMSGEPLGDDARPFVAGHGRRGRPRRAAVPPLQHVRPAAPPPPPATTKQSRSPTGSPRRCHGRPTIRSECAPPAALPSARRTEGDERSGPDPGAVGVVDGIAHHGGSDPLAEHLDLHPTSEVGPVGRQVREGDRRSHPVALAAARDPADDLAVDPHRLRSERHRQRIVEHEASQPAAGPVALTLGQRVAADELAGLVQLHGEAEAGLVRVVLGGDVDAPHPVALLDPQRVDGAVPAGDQAVAEPPPPRARPTGRRRTPSGSTAPSRARPRT